MHGSGRITLRNRRFLRTYTAVNHPQPSIIPSPPVNWQNEQEQPENIVDLKDNGHPAQSEMLHEPQNNQNVNTETVHLPKSNILKRLADYNKPGIKESQTLLPRRKPITEK